jgi:hypothetical protein
MNGFHFLEIVQWKKCINGDTGLYNIVGVSIAQGKVFKLRDQLQRSIFFLFNSQALKMKFRVEGEKIIKNEGGLHFRV